MIVYSLVYVEIKFPIIHLLQKRNQCESESQIFLSLMNGKITAVEEELSSNEVRVRQ